MAAILSGPMMWPTWNTLWNISVALSPPITAPCLDYTRIPTVTVQPTKSSRLP